MREKGCLLVINTLSGNAAKAIGNTALVEKLTALYGKVDTVQIEEDSGVYDMCRGSVGYAALAVCGGDGTFNSAINATDGRDIALIYIPCGTLNDTAHTLKTFSDLQKGTEVQMDIGSFNDKSFSYVAATGSFTPIGYLPKTKYKKVFKKLTYYFYALKEYKLYKHKAKITIDGKSFDDTYTLIMAVKSKYVFGLPFNRLYVPNNGKGQLLLITTPRGIFKYITMFFLFFRAFFIGFDKEKLEGKVKFLEFSRCEICETAPPIYCVDGEAYQGAEKITIEFKGRTAQIMLI